MSAAFLSGLLRLEITNLSIGRGLLLGSFGFPIASDHVSSPLGFLLIGLPPSPWHIRKLLMSKVSTAIVCASLCLGRFSHAQEAASDLILHHGKIVAVDDRFSIHEAIAVRDGHI